MGTPLAEAWALKADAIESDPNIMLERTSTGYVGSEFERLK
jgi:hypothetical protein